MDFDTLAGKAYTVGYRAGFGWGDDKAIKFYSKHDNGAVRAAFSRGLLDASRCPSL